jgi:hypothetical protein
MAQVDWDRNDLWMRIRDADDPEGRGTTIFFTKMVYVLMCVFVRNEMLEARIAGGTRIEAFVSALKKGKRGRRKPRRGELSDFDAFYQNWHKFPYAFELKQRIWTVIGPDAEELSDEAAKGFLSEIFPFCGSTSGTAEYHLRFEAERFVFSQAVEREYAPIGDALRRHQSKHEAGECVCGEGKVGQPAVAGEAALGLYREYVVAACSDVRFPGLWAHTQLPIVPRLGEIYVAPAAVPCGDAAAKQLPEVPKPLLAELTRGTKTLVLGGAGSGKSALGACRDM